MENYKSRLGNMNRSQIVPSHKRAFSSYENSNIINKKNTNNSQPKNDRQIINFFNSKYGKNKYKSKKIGGAVDDFKRLAKKYYNIIIGLQEELTKQTIKNYNLIEENMELKQKINEVMQGQ